MPLRLPGPPALAALVLAASLARPAAAQRVVATLDVGGTGLRYGDSLTVTNSVAGSIAPAIRAEWSRMTIGASGSWSHLGNAWSSQGALAASLFTPALGPLVGELAGSGAGSLHSDDTRAAQGLGTARLHLMGRAVGLWAGAGAGGVTDSAAGAWRPLKVGDGGAWARWGKATLLASAAPTWVDDAPVFTDGEVALRIAGSRAELGAAVGRRFGTIPAELLADRREWVSASLLLRMPMGAALVASGGTYPADLAQRFPGGSFASLGLRLGRWPVSPGVGGADVSRPVVREDAPPTAEESTARAGGMLGFVARPDPDEPGRTLVRVRAPGAHFVEVYGDFTEWRPAALRRIGDGWWAASLPTDPGTHEISVRVDGGAWLVPPGLTAVRDEFGGTAGVLVVP